MLFELNATYVIFIISFFVFMWLLNEVMLKPVGHVLEERAKLIEDEIAAGKQAHREAEELQSKYEADLRKIREESQAVIAKAVEEANKVRNDQIGKVAAEGRAKLDKAKEEIAAEREKLIDALVAEERELVETITRKVLGDETVTVSIDASKVRRGLEEAS
jgi:F-type H+-transporting ATPase subunit b